MKPGDRERLGSVIAIGNGSIFSLMAEPYFSKGFFRLGKPLQTVMEGAKKIGAGYGDVVAVMVQGSIDADQRFL